MRVTAFFDGGCLNRVRAAGAAILYDEDGEEIARRAHYMEGESATVNVAEYCGLLIALELAQEANADEVVVYGDTELIVRHFTGRYECRKEHLKPWLAAVRLKASEFRSCQVLEIPKSGKHRKRRNGNVAADALATACQRAGHDLWR